MEQELKLLMLEDNADDAALIRRVLEKAEFTFTSLLVDTREQFVEGLISFSPDAILSDHQLPQFSSTEALDICRNRFPHMPFILVSGAASDEFAASIIKAGADDYLLKSNLRRLPTAILQTLEKHKVQIRLEESEANLRAIMDQTEVGYLLLSKDLKVLSYNSIYDVFIELEMGNRVKEGQDVYAILPNSNPEWLAMVLDKSLHGQVVEIDLEFGSGSYRWYHIRYSPLIKVEEIAGILISVIDITFRKRAEREIYAAHKELSELIENANAPIFGANKSGLIDVWNKVSEEMSGFTKTDVIGTHLLEGPIRQEDREKFKFILDKVTKGIPISNLEVPVLTKEGKEVILLLNVTPRRNSRQELSGVLMVGQDITELISYRHNLEGKVEARTRELNEVLRKERDLVELKGRFVSMASHEFRTPLSTICFASENIRAHLKRLTPDEVKGKLSKIEDQANHMARLLEDVLTIGKADAGKIKVNRISLDVKQLVETIIGEINASIKTKHDIQFSFSGANRKLMLDDKLFRNVLINLLTNAIKFSPADSTVWVDISLSPEAIDMKVADEGMGISQEELSTVFEAFQRGSNANEIPGTGLGLSILKKAVQLMEGTVHLESVLNQGTTVIVNIPVK